jgi:hypothetical protein
MVEKYKLTLHFLITILEFNLFLNDLFSKLVTEFLTVDDISASDWDRYFLRTTGKEPQYDKGLSIVFI